MGRLDGKVAIVAGAGRGIGRATAKLFAAEGARVVAISLKGDEVDAVAAEIADAGGVAVGIACDVAIPDQVDRSVSQAVETFGGIDVLVNLAFDPNVVMGSIAELSAEQLQRNFDTGPIAYLRVMQACFPHLKKSGAGRVINFASLAGVAGLLPYGPYNMAKEAVRALTRTAAREWAEHGITVNNVLPQADTWGAGDDTPAPTNVLGRHGSPEHDIAPVVLFLASADSQFLTGYSLTPDGGQIIDAAR